MCRSEVRATHLGLALCVGALMSAAGCGSGDDDSPAADGDMPQRGQVEAPGQDADDPIGHVIAEPDDEASYVFDQGELRTYNLLIEPAELALLDMEPAAEMYVTGMLEFEGESYGPIGVRYKGSIGAFGPPCTGSNSFGGPRGPKTGKCSIKIDFDRVDAEARFYGLKKLNLHAMGIDPSMMRDRLGYAMFRESGIAASRAVHARVLINGELEGVYIAVEQVDGRFTHSRFSEGGDGNVYKEVWPSSVTPERYQSALATNQDQGTSVQRMVDFANALAAGEDSFEWLDPQYVFNYAAVDRVIANDDGAFHWYCFYSHNYYWYEAERADRFWLIPWDLDYSFLVTKTIAHIPLAWNADAESCACAGMSRPSSCDPLIGQWANRSDDYERAVDKFLAGPFAEGKVNAKLAAWSAQIDAAVLESSGVHGAPTYEEWQEALASFHADVETARRHRGYPYGRD